MALQRQAPGIEETSRAVMGTPSKESIAAWHAIKAIIEPRRRNAFFTRPLLFIYVMQALATAVAVGVLLVITSDRPLKDPQVLGAVVSAQLIMIPFTLWLTRALNIDPVPVVLRKDEWKAKGFFKQYGIQMSFVVALIGSAAGVAALFK